MRRLWVVVLCLLLSWAPVCVGGIRTVRVSTEPVVVYVRSGVPLAVTFPEAIAAIPAGVDPGDLSLEIEGERLFIQSLTEGFDARLFVIGVSGRLYQLQLTERPGEADGQVQLVEPVAPPVFGSEAPPAPEAETPPRFQGNRQRGALRRLLSAMLEGRRLAGVSVVDHAQTLYDDGKLTIGTRELHVAGRYLGYVAVAENRASEPVALRLPEYRAPGLKAIAAEREILEPGETGLVWLVVELERR